MIFDTHTHYDDKAFDEDRDGCLLELKKQGIDFVVNVGASIDSSKSTLELCQTYDFIYGAVGVHPSETANMTMDDLAWLEAQLEDKKVVALGEIGLDYYWDTPDRELQKKWFQEQLNLAIHHDMPVIIHSREAAADTYDMLKDAYGMAREQNGNLHGVIHCFSYGPDMAEKFVQLGFYLGIGGVVTFKNAKKLKEVVERIPMESLVLETDCPYLSPEPYRGKRNDSTKLTYVINQIAEIKKISYHEVVQITTENAKKLYRLS